MPAETDGAPAKKRKLRSAAPYLIIYAAVLSLVLTPLVFYAGTDLPVLMIVTALCGFCILAGYLIWIRGR